LIDVPDTCQVVFVGVDDTGPVPATPKVSGASDQFIVPYGYPGVKILHCSVEILFCGCSDDVIMVGHNYYMMDEKVIFFMGFLQCLKNDADDLSLVEPEGPVVGSTDQVVGVDILYDSQWTSHADSYAKSLPTFIMK